MGFGVAVGCAATLEAMATAGLEAPPTKVRFADRAVIAVNSRRSLVNSCPMLASNSYQAARAGVEAEMSCDSYTVLLYLVLLHRARFILALVGTCLHSTNLQWIA